MNYFDKKMLFILLKKLPSQSSIPRSGTEALSVDCNVVYLKGKIDNWTFLVEKTDRKGIYGKFWFDVQEAEDFCIPYVLLNDYTVDITHYFRYYDLKHESFIQYFFEGVIPIDWLRMKIGIFHQYFFNKKDIIRSDRRDILRVVLEKHLNGNDVNSLSLLRLIHTTRLFSHPDKSVHIKYTLLILKSLQDSGDIELMGDGISYKPKPKALTSIASHEEENKRHREQIDQSKGINRLTVILIIVGLIQAVVAYYK